MMAADLALGQRAPDFEGLPGVDGKLYSTSSFEGKPILVVVFFGNGCPTCKAAEERLIALQRDYGGRGVQVVLVNPNNSSLSPPDTFREMTKRAQRAGYNFPYLKDEGRALARALGAVTTPHAFVLDAQRRLRYRGSIDNARQKSRVTVHEVRDALEDILSSRAVRTPETSSFGCAIVW